MAIAAVESTVKKVVAQARPTITMDALMPAFPVIIGTRMKSSTPRMFWSTGKKTPNQHPCLFLTSSAEPASVTYKILEPTWGVAWVSELEALRHIEASLVEELVHGRAFFLPDGR